VVYDTYFGNTERIARAIGETLSAVGQVGIVRAGETGPEELADVNLLVVGSPTRAFRPTRAVSNFLKRICPDGLRGMRVSAFDTRLDIDKTNSRLLSALVRRFGYAAEPIGKRLEKKGGVMVMEPEGFFVEEAQGPLVAGELDRAKAWARLALRT